MNDRGRIFITERAVSRIVAAAAQSVPGTTQVGKTLDRIAARSFPRYDVLVDAERGVASIEAFIAVTWPAPVTRVAEEVRATITDWVTGMTGLQVTHCNILVGTVVKGEHRVTAELIDASPDLPALRPVTVREPKVASPQEAPDGPSRMRLHPVTVASEQTPQPEVVTAPEQPLMPITVASEDRELPEVSIALPRPLTPITVTPWHPLSPAQEKGEPRVR
ncbi:MULTISPECIES: Asp23/Gls24 family envelope stress response protein [unclassified Corynebacterium]|uniref:Asp23/Gls24 family envelope stress response protein n=1 Tax=unclassified Corynebacterium TaxID=2624378 RepID=UPI0029CA6346|nr:MULTISPECIES: Asp23/Gls24 family envelope stress response protein [unclassified Corynebacterium]WPF66470.1 Asp23/Gls24 family envelope stress response protein [Corynebacterium sp. 22KM0430]WPF68960.1 Asp23/Gls24 family envelope stress response protein [Corynebacterium sp. 21KM1197]